MHPRYRLVLFAAVLGAALSLAASAQEWTRYRGPHGSGISDAKTIPVRFTEKDFNWRIQLPGTGHSSPVLWGNRLFITSADEGAKKRYVLCFDAKDGKRLWTAEDELHPFRMNRLNHYAAATPAVDAEGVYVLWSTPMATTVVAYSHQGEELWREKVGVFEARHGAGASPVVVDGVVIVPNDHEAADSFLCGLNHKTGKQVWRRKRNSSRAAYSTPLDFADDGGRTQVVFTSTAHGITSLDPATGELVWELPKVFTARCVGSPVLVKGLVFAIAGGGGIGREAVAVQPGDGQHEAKVVYKLTRDLPYVPLPVSYGPWLFTWRDNGRLICRRAADGELLWEATVSATTYGSAVCVDGKLYCMDTKGHCYVVAAAEKFQLLADNDLGEPTEATPAVANGAMYLRTVSHLISVGGK